MGRVIEVVGYLKLSCFRVNIVKVQTCLPMYFYYTLGILEIYFFQR